MRPLKSSRPHMRAALVAMLATLAATTIAAPGAARAEASDLLAVDMFASCDHLSPVIFTKVKCTGTVRDLSSTTAPTGELQMFIEGKLAGNFPTGTSRCTLQPVAGSPQASRCTVIYEPRRLGLQFMTMAYLGDAHFDPAADDIPLITLEGVPTATGISCQKVNFGESGKCIVTVKDNGGSPQAPSGIVSFGSKLLSAPVEFTPSFCQLQPLTSFASRCEVQYWPTKPGTWSLVARYEGSATVHRPSSGETSVTVNPPVNAPALAVGE